MKKYIPLILLKVDTSNESVASLVNGVLRPVILIENFLAEPGSKGVVV
jgi:hypothetical protein